MEINNRILIVDDSESIRNDFLKILCPKKAFDLSSTEAFLFGDGEDVELDLDELELSALDDTTESPYELDFASQGEEAWEKVHASEQEGRPYAFIFTDVVMPPGMDGVQLAKKIWSHYPETEIVMVTAYADYSWEGILGELGETSRLLIIKKPFDRITIKQLAVTLTAKTAAESELKDHRDHLQEEVSKRTAALVRMNKDLGLKTDLLESVNRHYETLFERNEVSIWYEDFTAIKAELDRFASEGVTDLEAHLRANPDVLMKLAGLVKVCDVNEATLRMFRADSTPDLFTELGKVFNEDHLETFLQELLAIWKGDSYFRTEVEYDRGNGTKMYLILSLSIPRTADEFSQVPVSVRDITKQKKAEEILKYQAYYDDLTKLANKKLFQERLELALEESKRKQFSNRMTDLSEKQEKSLIAVMFIDLDGFKAINDNLGHAAGDQLLQLVADRLRDCVKRRSDTVARLGGDEFAVILPNLGKAFHAETVGRRVLTALNVPFELQVTNRKKTEVVSASISGSVGISVFPNDSMEADELVEKADTAMYKAKKSGKNQLRFFTPEMEGEAQRRRTLERSLEIALEREEFEVFYQPVVDLKTGRMVLAEALLRWRHEEQGWISPSEFVPLAEETGLINQIDMWVLRQVCKEIGNWNGIELPAINFSMNLSSRLCRDARFCEMLSEILHEEKVDPDRLSLEVTESLFQKSGKKVRRDLEMIHETGVRLVLDDFGTGISSLTDLREFPFNQLKIDRSVVSEAGSYTFAVIGVAKGLGLEVVGEGVENRRQLQYLVEHDCDLAQGFFFSEPAPARDLRNYAGENAFLRVLA